MKIFNLIQLNNAGAGATCKKCTYFENDPAIIEETYNGLTSFSSGFASVRDQDGFCNYNQLYLSAHDNCPHFALHISEFNKEP